MHTHLKGGKLEPETEMDLYAALPENWVGYFVEYPQMPSDCFNQDDWDALNSVVTRYWSIHKYTSPTGGSYWLSSGKITPFEYGDLVILGVDYNHSFSWVESDNKAESMSLPETSYYEYEEQASYVPYFIEMDSVSEAQEVAVLADGEVTGACVREAGDTIVEVRAYLEQMPPDAEITVETWTGMKSGAPNIDYSVYNQKQHRYEKRKAMAGETVTYQLISLKSSVTETAAEPLPAEISCYPNPFNDHVKFRIEMKQTAKVQLEILDLNGRAVTILCEGKLEKGWHTLSWEGQTQMGNDLAPGMYYYRLVIDDQLSTSGKLIKR
jgi:hypothetical protein